MTFVALPAVTLHVREEGAAGPVLVLLHELGGSLHSFDAVAEALRGSFRVLRYDQRGAGQSEKPRRPCSLADHEDDLAALLTARGIATPVLLAGVAAGAAIAVGYAIARPTAVAGLVLCAPALTVPAERRGYLADRSALAGREGMRAVADASLARSWPPHLRGDGTRYAEYRARFLGNDPVSYGHANLALAEADLEPRLDRVVVPCRVLAGGQDLLRPPAEVEAVASRIPGASYHLVQESGHLMSVQAPGAVVDTIVALQSQRSTAG
jgi:3-oxoadipate enol-lactonase